MKSGADRRIVQATPVLILFDIDATLITTSRTGVAAMGEAGRERFGPEFDENRVEYAGRLDPLIIADLLRAHGQEVSDAAITQFRARYREHLIRLLGKPGVARPCPGIPALLDALRQRPQVLGLLTGNFPETGAIKLRASGIEPDHFPIQAWGCDSPLSPPARDHLPPVAMTRFTQRFGKPIAGRNVTIIGDTPHDIACARAHRCRSLGVATGHFSVEALRAAGADHAVQDLSDTAEIVAWLMSTPGAGQ